MVRGAYAGHIVVGCIREDGQYEPAEVYGTHCVPVPAASCGNFGAHCDEVSLPYRLSYDPNQAVQACV